VTSAAVLGAPALTLVPAQAAGPASSCNIVIPGAQWSIRAPAGLTSGNRYTVAARGMTCSAARPWVVKFTHEKTEGPGQQGLGQILKGPSGFKCRSFSEQASGDTLVYSRVCMHPPHNVPFFEWAPKLGK
jgi:hypothetical protein